MPEMTQADLAAFRDAVQFRDRCVAEAMELYRRIEIAPSAVHARAAFDAMSPLIAEREADKLRAVEAAIHRVG